MTVCIVDTSILDELLDVPGFASQHNAVVDAFAEKRARERFLLPLPVLIETGNHVAQIRSGASRRTKATLFVEFARAALDGTLPFVPTPFPLQDELSRWLDDFPDWATKEVGLVDRSLIALWYAHRELLPGRRVYIWTLDAHLRGYDTGDPRRTRG